MGVPTVLCLHSDVLCSIFRKVYPQIINKCNGLQMSVMLDYAGSVCVCVFVEGLQTDWTAQICAEAKLGSQTSEDAQGPASTYRLLSRSHIAWMADIAAVITENMSLHFL